MRRAKKGASMASSTFVVSTRRAMREWPLYNPRPTHWPSRSRISTTLPGGGLGVGFSTIFWKIHGCDERRAILSRTSGKESPADAACDPDMPVAPAAGYLVRPTFFLQELRK